MRRGREEVKGGKKVGLDLISSQKLRNESENQRF